MVVAFGTMASEGQQRDASDTRALSSADTWSYSSEGSNDSYLATDDAECGHVNLALDPVLNQPPAAAINVSNSSDVHIGPRLSYNAPVTINQYVNVAPGGDEKQVSVGVPLQLNGTGKTALSGIGTVGGLAAGSTDGGKRSEHRSSDRSVRWWQRRKIQLSMGMLVVLLVIISVLVVLLRPTDGSNLLDSNASEAYTKHVSRLPPKDPPQNPNFTLSDGHRIIRSFEWNDVPPAFVRPLHHPTPYVVIAHTAMSKPCIGAAECFRVLRDYRDMHRADWEQPDITYNFLIDLAGNIYEGRGWDATNNLQGWVKRCNLEIALFGNFLYINTTERMTQSLKLLLDLGVRIGKLAKDYRLLAHKQVDATLSPGQKIMEVIEDWDHRCLSDCDVGMECIYIGPDEMNKDNTTTVTDILKTNATVVS